jgi:hypothetical protein
MRHGYEDGRIFRILAMNYKHCNNKIREHLSSIIALNVNTFVTYISLVRSLRRRIAVVGTGSLSPCLSAARFVVLVDNR